MVFVIFDPNLHVYPFLDMMICTFRKSADTNEDIGQADIR
jgi:hypothetical protein